MVPRHIMAPRPSRPVAHGSNRPPACTGRRLPQFQPPFLLRISLPLLLCCYWLGIARSHEPDGSRSILHRNPRSSSSSSRIRSSSSSSSSIRSSSSRSSSLRRGRGRSLYEAEAALRALHHHLPADWAANKPADAAASANNAFHSPCWSARERRYYQSPHSSSTPLSEPFLHLLQQYDRAHAACTQPIASWPSFLNQSSQGLVSGTPPASVAGCKYLVFHEPAYSGLGNQLLSLASSFLLSLLTNRTLLIGPKSFPARLLCNPLPTSHWVPPALTHGDFNLLKSRTEFNSSRVGYSNYYDVSADVSDAPNLAFVDLSYKANSSDLSFFCSHTQRQLAPVRFLGLLSEEYFLPGLYLVPEFDAHLSSLFPDRRVFSHTARFLLHPANYLWDELTGFFRTHLSRHHLRVGVQIRDFIEGDHPHLPLSISRVRQCAVNVTRGLPIVFPHDRFRSIMMGEAKSVTDSEKAHLAQAVSGGRRSVGVLVASLRREYADALHDEYSEGRTLGGVDVAVTSLSHEGKQITGHGGQFEKAIKEMWLLSMCDLIIVSDTSTFGYIAAGLAGVSPYSLNIVPRMNSDWRNNGRAACAVTTPEPCYLTLMFASQKRVKCPGSTSDYPLNISSKLKLCPNLEGGVVLDVPNPEKYETYRYLG